MSELDEPDEIARELDAIFAEFFGPPTETDLRGVDPATFALGLSYGFDSWQQARVVANNRRHVATAARHWAEHHPTPEFLSHAAGTDESAVRHRELLDRAHPGCAACEEHLLRLAGVPAGGGGPAAGHRPPDRPPAAHPRAGRGPVHHRRALRRARLADHRPGSPRATRDGKIGRAHV